MIKQRISYRSKIILGVIWFSTVLPIFAVKYRSASHIQKNIETELERINAPPFTLFRSLNTNHKWLAPFAIKKYSVSRVSQKEVFEYFKKTLPESGWRFNSTEKISELYTRQIIETSSFCKSGLLLVVEISRGETGLSTLDFAVSISSDDYDRCQR